MNKPTIVFSTGAGMSAESGINTFRDSGGLWENHSVMDVASADGLRRNPDLVMDFYNKRRKEVFLAQPNQGHKVIAQLEKHFNVQIITQNIDNLHERAGSTSVLHLHGEVDKVRALDDDNLVYTLTPENACVTTQTTIDGHLLRPHIVFFQEAVPNFEPATKIVAQADIFVIIGTSLVVYPAASLLQYVRPGTPVYYIDPHPAAVPQGITIIQQGASQGLKTLVDDLKKKHLL